MAKTKVDKAPYSTNGSLLHYPADGRTFSHYESDAGERLERSDIWETIQETSPHPWGRLERQKRDDWKLVMTEPDWRPNLPFHAAFQIDSMRSGRSAKYVILTPVNAPDDPRTFPMFVSDLIDVAQRQGILVGGVMSGRWMVAKRGMNYGLRLAKDEET